MLLDRSTAWRAALLAALLGLIVFGTVGLAYLQSLKAANQYAGSSLAQRFALRVVERFNETLGPVYMLAVMARQHPRRGLGFDEVAADLIREFPLIRALELAPGGVVKQVYPLRGNEMIVGHDLLTDKERNKDAHTALTKKQLTLAGPVELKQGGLGAIARYPIFIRGQNGKSYFWGFSIAVIDVPQLLTISGEMELERGGYDYRLCRIPAGEDGCKTFAGRGAIMMDQAVSVNIALPNNTWVLSVAPQASWVSLQVKLLVIGLVLIAALLVGAGLFLVLSRLAAQAESP